MNRLITMGAWILAFAPAALAQGTLGTIDFRTRLASVGLDAPTSVFGQAPGGAYSAGLYHEGALIPGSVTTFYDPVQNPMLNPLLAQYVIPITVPVPETTPGQENFVVQMRVWLASAGSYENAQFAERGGSEPLVIAMLGGDSVSRPNHLPASFTGILIMPEPSVIALGVFGLVLFAGWRCMGGNLC